MATGKGPTDFNDLGNAGGLQAVAEALNAPPITAYEEDADQENATQTPDARSEPRGMGWEANLREVKPGTIDPCVYNTHLILTNDEEWAGVLGYCDFSYRIIKRSMPPWKNGTLGEWTDADTARLRLWFSTKYRYTPRSADADEQIMVVAQNNNFHPVRDYLNSLTWDKKPRLRSWLKTYLGVESAAEDNKERDRYEQYQSLVGVMWMIAAVARVMRPPVKADCVMIIEGLQGLGKSTALSILGGEWFSDTHFALGEKDGYQQMQGLWICELAELDSFNKAESTRAKQFFGSSEDRYRPAYGRRTQAFARQCVFAGTTNQDAYLKDPTGNRRYWPVFCTRLDAEGLARDRDQLWAEAYQLFKLGEPWWVPEHFKHLFEEQQESRFCADAWEEFILEYVRDPTKYQEGYTTGDLLVGALNFEASKIRQPEQTRVGQIMTRLGWKRVRMSVGTGSSAHRPRWYVRPDGWK
ncbi:virulence-associated E family protein [uncultured Zhongshania sp.]|uniref:virulence-associated E family protein n=1 Tax=uncultured Zhongshania sp. TaxID=1642288 RepID=UPI0030D958F1